MNESEILQILEQLRRVGSDSSRVEVKAAFQGLPKEIPETIVAFANTSGGTIILGVDEAAGFSTSEKFRAPRILAALKDAFQTKVEPIIRPGILEIVPVGNHHVVVASVPELDKSDKPAYVKAKGRRGGSYTRMADGDHRLTNYEIDRLMEQTRQPEWDRELLEEASLDDLDQTILNSIVDRERSLHPRIFGKLPFDKAVQNLNLVANDPSGTIRPTLAGLLAAGLYPQKYLPQLSVTVTHYAGLSKATDELGFKNLADYRLEGSIPVMIEEAVSRVKEILPRRSQMRGIYRNDYYGVPPVVIREAVTNALMHRDYSPAARGTQVQVNLYADRLEVVNAGGLYGTVTAQTIGEQTLSSSRNMILARILESTPYQDKGFVAENRGSGYQEMLAQLRKQGRPLPKVKDSLTAFRLIFPLEDPSGLRRHEEPRTTAKEAIVQYLEEHESASSRELAEYADAAVNTVRRAVNELISEGSVQRIGQPRSPKVRYRLNNGVADFDQ